MTENTRDVENILILGNGFDVAMGRKTKYTEFWEFLVILNLFYNFHKSSGGYLLTGKKNSKTKLENNYIEYIKKIDNDLSDLLDHIHPTSKTKIDDAIKETDTFRRLYLLSPVLKKYLDEIEKIRKKSGINITLTRKREIFNECLKPKNSILSQHSHNKIEINKIYEILFDKKRPLRWDFLIKLNNSLLLNFIKTYRESIGENWSNLELIISDLAGALSDIKQHIKDYEIYFNSNGSANTPELTQAIEELNKYQIRSGQEVSDIIADISDIDDNSGIHISDFPNKSNPAAYAYILERIQNKNGEDRPLQSIFKELNEELEEDLEFLTNMLEFYLTYLNKVENISNNDTIVLNELNSISESKVLNFNYTDTIKNFGVTKNNIHFIHGKLNFDRISYPPINQMVFGIEDKEENVNTDLIPYQKFYQRVVKETGSQYEEFFKTDTDKNIVVFGHSVDPLDKEIFQNCFNLAESGGNKYQFIFAYYDDTDKYSIAKNLAIILDKEKFVKLSGEGKIKFVKSDDRERMRKILDSWEESRQLATAE